MDWFTAIAAVVAVAFIGWELTETWRLQASAMRKRKRQNAELDRGDEPKS